MIPSKKFLKNLVSSDSHTYNLAGVHFHEETSELIITNAKAAGFYKVPKEAFKNVSSIMPIESFDFHKNVQNDPTGTPMFEEIEGRKIKVSETIIEKSEVIEQTKTRSSIEGRFPKIHEVIPKGEPSTKILLSIDHLKNIVNSVYSSDPNYKGELLIEYFGDEEPLLFTPQLSEINQGFLMMTIKEGKEPKSYFRGSS